MKKALKIEDYLHFTQNDCYDHEKEEDIVEETRLLTTIDDNSRPELESESVLNGETPVTVDENTEHPSLEAINPTDDQPVQYCSEFEDFGRTNAPLTMNVGEADETSTKVDLKDSTENKWLS